MLEPNTNLSIELLTNLTQQQVFTPQELLGQLCGAMAQWIINFACLMFVAYMCQHTFLPGLREPLKKYLPDLTEEHKKIVDRAIDILIDLCDSIMLFGTILFIAYGYYEGLLSIEIKILLGSLLTAVVGIKIVRWIRRLMK